MEQLTQHIPLFAAIASALAAISAAVTAWIAYVGLRTQLYPDPINLHYGSAKALVGDRKTPMKVNQIDYEQERKPPRWAVTELRILKAKRRFVPKFVTRKLPILLPQPNWIVSLGSDSYGNQLPKTYTVSDWQNKIEYDTSIYRDRLLVHPDVKGKIMLHFRVVLRVDDRIRDSIYIPLFYYD